MTMTTTTMMMMMMNKDGKWDKDHVIKLYPEEHDSTKNQGQKQNNITALYSSYDDVIWINHNLMRIAVNTTDDR